MLVYDVPTNNLPCNAGAGVGKTQLVKGKLAALPEGMMSLSISFNYFTDVVSFQKASRHHLHNVCKQLTGPWQQCLCIINHCSSCCSSFAPC